MKKIISLFTTLCIVFAMLGTFTVFAAESGTYKDTMTWTLDDNGTLTIGGAGIVAYEPNDPMEFDQLPWNKSREQITQIIFEEGITGIEGEWTFAGLENLQSVTFPESITVIGYEAFLNCISLTSVTIPAGVKEIGQRAFGYCSSLVSINVDEDNSYYSSLNGVLYDKEQTEIIQFPAGRTDTSYTFPDSITSIGGDAFMYDSNLTSIIIPDSVKSIGMQAFYECENLADISIGSGVTDIEMYVFDGTAYYNDESKWDNNVLYIGDYLIEAKQEISGDYEIKIGTRVIADHAFYYCLKLTGITIPDSVKHIGKNAFGYCAITDIAIPGGITKISEDMFSYCTNLTSVTIPDSVISIDDGAFQMCTKLTDIEIPISVTKIGWNAFGNCPLTSVTIPAGVTSIGKHALSGYNITEIIVDANNPNYISDDGILFNKDKTELILYPGKKEGNSYAIPDSVITIRESSFSNSKNLTEIIIPDSVKNIGASAFSYCTGLTEFTIPDSVTDLDARVFSDCQNLTSVTIGKGVKTIGSQTFYDCYALTDVTVPDNVTEIGDYAFSYCKNLASVTLGSGVAKIGVNIFNKCDKFKDIYYYGTQEDFEKISIDEDNSQLTKAAIHYITPPPHTHTLVHHEAAAATCTETGTGEYWKCEGDSGCNKLFGDENAETEIDQIPVIPAKGHNWGVWTTIKPATVNEEGEQKRICSNCNETETKSIPKIPEENYDFNIKYENEKAVITVPQDGTYTVIFASYDNGRLLSVDAKNISLVKGENSLAFPQNFNVNGTVKVMLWDSLTDMKPLCAA